MFDSIDLSQAISDIYEKGLNDDNLNLVYEANKEIYMAVNTPYGITDRETVMNSFKVSLEFSLGFCTSRFYRTRM